MDLTLGNRAPPFGQLTQRIFAGAASPHQITAYGGAGSPDPAPAVEVDLSACLQRYVDPIQDQVHLFGRGQTKIADGKAMVFDLHFIEPGLLLKNVHIGNGFVRPGQINERVETGFDQLIKAVACEIDV